MTIDETFLRRSRNPDVCSVKEEDAKFIQVIEKEKHILNYFKDSLENPKPQQSYYSIKKKLTDRDHVKHIWLDEVQISGKVVYGIANNLPTNLKIIELGKKSGVSEDEINDWLFLENNKLIGGYTVRLIRNLSLKFLFNFVNLQVISSKIVILIIISCLLITKATKGQPYCDNSLIPLQDNNLSYMNRGNRCEGFYESKISGGLQIVGLIRGTFDFKRLKDEEIDISCPKYNDNVILRIQAIPLKTYYRMDALILPNQHFKWPLNDVIIPAKTLLANDLGLLGFIKTEKKRVYIPLKAESNKIQEDTINYVYIIFRSTSALKNIQYKVISEKTELNKKWTLLKTPSAYEGNPICIKFPFNDPGLYLFVLSGEVKYSEGEWYEEQVYVKLP